ncbi:MAG TPA: serine/threonine-protein kinase [Planctomycetaceae bacterium]|nr:serine/threonine-protein kinase [Planctomycetaceae bacterium]
MDEDATVYPTGPALRPEAPVSLGDYDLLEEIARGGMGVVCKARQRSLNRIVALKLIRSGELASAREVARFRAEAEAAAQLEHPGIVPVYEVGEQNGYQFLSMALLEGGSLAERLEQGPLGAVEASELLKSIAEAIHFAHERGVVHRDLKPQNILLDNQGIPRVTDFGIAKDLNVDSGLTVTGQIVGTPSYMPPEQATGTGSGPLVDVYALGATLYCLLTGRPPFQAATPLETIQQLIEHEPVSPRSLNAAIPQDLETICLKCLRKEPDKRYRSAAALAEDLDRWLTREPILARPVSRAEKMWLWCRRRPAVAGAIAAGVFSLCMVAVLISVRESGKSRETNLEDRLHWENYMSQVRTLDRLLSMAQSRKYRQAVEEAERLMHSDKVTPLMMYDLGCVFSLACETANSYSDIPHDEKRDFTREYAQLAVDALEAAHRLGYFRIPENQALLVNDPDLSSVRTEARFRELLERVIR